MTETEIEAIAIPHKLFAVFTAPDGELLFRKMWSKRLVAYLSGIGAMNEIGWEEFVKNADVGQVWDMPLESGTWMALIRIRDDQDRGDTV